MISIKRNTKTPIYVQIKEMLEQDISKGKYLPNEKIPAEIELAKSLNVSRMTVNKVIYELVRQGLLQRHQGKGTFVASRKMDHWFFRITSFNRDMISRGLTPSTLLLEKKVVKCPNDAQMRLQLLRGEKVIFVRRLRCADGEPMMLESRYLNYAVCKGILEEPLDKESIHDLLIYKYNLPLTKVNQYLEAVKINVAEAKLLQVAPGDPGFLLDRTTFTGASPVTWVRYVHRGDRYRFYAEFVPVE